MGAWKSHGRSGRALARGTLRIWQVIPAASLLGWSTRGANAENSAARCLLSPASAASGSSATSGNCAAPGNSATSGDSATSCVRTATIDTACDRTATVLIVWIAITTATGYNGSPANDRTATIGGTTSGNSTTSRSATSGGAASGSAAAPD